MSRKKEQIALQKCENAFSDYAKLEEKHEKSKVSHTESLKRIDFLQASNEDIQNTFFEESSKLRKILTVTREGLEVEQ